MAYIHCVTGGSGGGIPPQLQTDMNAVFNKKFGTTGQSYPSTDWAKDVNVMGLLPEKTVSGAVASFPDGADDVPLKTATFNIDPTLDGVSAVNVVRSGKNLFTSVGSESGYYLNANGVKISDANWMLSDYIEVPSNATLYFNPNSNSGSGAKHVFYDSTKTFISYVDSGAGSFTTPTNCKYMRFSYRSASTDIQLEVGSSATAYTPYVAPTTRTISLGQTVYGGSVTVDEDGECELESTYCTPIDLGSLDWTFYSNAAYPYMMADISDYKWVNNNPNVECEGYNFASIGSTGNAEGFFLTNTNIIRIRDLNYQTAESLTDFKAHVTGLDLSYEVTTPTQSDLDPITPINTLLGVNNIWCDTGDVESLTYRRTPILPISLKNNYLIGVSATTEYQSPIDANNYIDVSDDTVTLHRNAQDKHLFIYTPLVKAGQPYLILWDSVTNTDGNLYIQTASDISTNPVTVNRIATTSGVGYVFTPSADCYYGVAFWSNNTNNITVKNPRLYEL